MISGVLSECSLSDLKSDLSSVLIDRSSVLGGLSECSFSVVFCDTICTDNVLASYSESCFSDLGWLLCRWPEWIFNKYFDHIFLLFLKKPTVCNGLTPARGSARLKTESKLPPWLQQKVLQGNAMKCGFCNTNKTQAIQYSIVFLKLGLDQINLQHLEKMVKYEKLNIGITLPSKVCISIQILTVHF